jgi:alpha-galactosidase
VLSMCNPDPTDDPWVWGAPIANLWRTTTDIQDNFGSMLGNFAGTVDLSGAAGPGAWNDPDMLQIGNGGSSLLEYTAEFSMWAEMAAPLIASTNVAALSPAELAIYENQKVIAVDQDPLGQPGMPVSRTGGRWVLTKQLSGGDRAIVLFNSTDTAATIATTATAVGLRRSGIYRLEDLWTGAVSETGGAINEFVPAHGVAMYRVSALPGRRPRGLAPQTVLSLTPATPQIDVGQSTTVFESFTNDGVDPVKRVRLTFRAGPGWRVKRLGRERVARLAGGHRFTVAFRVTAPVVGLPVTLADLTGAASYDPIGGRRIASAMLGERVFAPVMRPLETANEAGRPGWFGASGWALAIRSRGTGVYAPVNNAPPTDSYAAVYERRGAGASSTAQVTVTSDQAGGTAGGAGLIERDAMTGARGSPAGVVLYVSGSATIVMAWNVSGGRDVDSRIIVPNNPVRVPVALRLVRAGSTYAGYYSTDRGATWAPAGTVAVAASASTGKQDVGVFHASGLPTWTTTATFTNLYVN